VKVAQAQKLGPKWEPQAPTGGGWAYGQQAHHRTKFQQHKLRAAGYRPGRRGKGMPDTDTGRKQTAAARRMRLLLVMQEEEIGPRASCGNRRGPHAVGRMRCSGAACGGPLAGGGRGWRPTPGRGPHAGPSTGAPRRRLLVRRHAQDHEAVLHVPPAPELVRSPERLGKAPYPLEQLQACPQPGRPRDLGDGRGEHGYRTSASSFASIAAINSFKLFRYSLSIFSKDSA
jgi:hypothetical protein